MVKQTGLLSLQNIVYSENKKHTIIINSKNNKNIQITGVGCPLSLGTASPLKVWSWPRGFSSTSDLTDGDQTPAFSLAKHRVPIEGETFDLLCQ